MGTTRKPKKPSKDFPLTPHDRGKWCKKVRGTIYCFGSLNEYLAIHEDLQAGRDPRREVAEPHWLDVGELVNL